jgi:hypothetical protein
MIRSVTLEKEETTVFRKEIKNWRLNEMEVLKSNSLCINDDSTVYLVEGNHDVQ